MYFPSASAPGKAFPPEFYYDTYNPVWQNKPRTYSFKLQWTQMNPNAVDRIVAYRLGFRQVRRPRGGSRAPRGSVLSSEGKLAADCELLLDHSRLFSEPISAQRPRFSPEMLVFLSEVVVFEFSGF